MYIMASDIGTDVVEEAKAKTRAVKPEQQRELQNLVLPIES